MHRSKIELHNVDCLPFMKQCRDKQFDLAIVDPPYGIGRDSYETGSKPSNLPFINLDKEATLKELAKLGVHSVCRSAPSESGGGVGAAGRTSVRIRNPWRATAGHWIVA